jgi:Skp family chaperone for outer membrane proteins
MKNLPVVVFAAGVAVAWTAPAFGQSFSEIPGVSRVPQAVSLPSAFPDEARIGYVDIERVAALSNEGKAATAKLTELRAKKSAEISERGKHVESLQQRLAQSESVLEATALARLRREFERARIDLQRLNEDAQAEVQDTQQQLLRAFTSRLFPVVGQVATEKKLWAVFSNENDLLWYLPAIDLSEEVAKRLNAPAPEKRD